MEKQTINQLTTVHYLELSHAIPLNPTNGLYGEKLDYFTRDKTINLPEQLLSRYCKNCHGILVPGWTMAQEIKFVKFKLKKKDTWKPRQRQLNITCLKCNHIEMTPLKTPTKPRPSTQEDPISAKQSNSTTRESSVESFVAKWPPESQSSNAVAKKRAKKRKMNSLSNLISQKKQNEENEKKKSNSLSLMEFMKLG